MADPTTIGLAVKAAATALSDERLRKTIGWITAAILSPLILIIIFICGLLSGTADHNNTAVELCFNGGTISDSVPENYRGYIEDMRNSFILLEDSIASLNAEMEDGDSLDPVRVKATFYSLFFGVESPSRLEHRKFAGCFVAYEARSRTVTNDDGTLSEEAYTVAVPVRELPGVYMNIALAMGMAITDEDQANASEIYYRVLYGRPIPTYGDEFDRWSDSLPLSSAPFTGTDGFCSPLGSGWRSMVTSEFGYRKDPFTGKGTGHGGIDLGAPKGIPIRAALPGIVYVVRYSTSGYGYHMMIDHGGGFVTLYAHCSKITVTEGQKVDAGTVIAEVGSTGRSTGPHLHFEVRINGVKQNPRNYLP
jgi:murein DD-endopeptidase MepM/ murein hydrolase activator NlpD